MFETGASVSVRATHVMPGVEGPEGQPHEHEYRIDVVASRAALDERGMVIDLDVLTAALDEMAATVDGADLEVIQPAEAEAVTVELFARWAHEQLSLAARQAGVDELAVRVWESPDMFGGYASSIA
ncbi:MAG: 6-carboxytetrahydropterin synthase [Acidimicrobiia bacterium]|nr:6-carboxytetrahydropterin synthase [Acidimicrobiia bacterium]